MKNKSPNGSGGAGEVANKFPERREEKLGMAAGGCLSRSVVDKAVLSARTPAVVFGIRRRFPSFWWACALVVTVVLLWCGAHDKWSVAAWQVPLDYSGDSAETLARIKAAAEGELRPFASQRLSRLGAPFGALWDEYPSSDAFANYGLGVLARFIGVGAASNVALLLAHLTAALAFYGCARILRYRREWAGAGALLFAFAYFNFARGLPHLWLTFTATVPAALLVSWLVGGSRRLVRMRWVWWSSLGVAGVIGSSNPYNLFLFLQLVGWATAAAFFRGRKKNALLGGLCVGAALAMMALAHLPTWIYSRDEGATPLLVRNYAGTEVYALKPIELFLPPSSHRSEEVASLGHRYLRWSEWLGETFSPYLGLIGGIGLLWVMVYSVVLLLEARRPQLPASGLQAIWIILFSSVGGLNALLAFYGGLQIFRATNRFSIFLLAIGLFFLISRLNRATEGWPRVMSVTVALALVVVGLLDQIPREHTLREKTALVAKFTADAEFGATLERELGTGAMVFQLPVLEFPEGRTRHGLNPLDKFHPYLATQTLRFSFGSRKNRSKSQWKIEIERLPIAALVAKLESIGFSAVLIERKGFEDRAESLLQQLAGAGRQELVATSHDEYVVVKLHPSPNPQPPLADEPTFGRGWYPPVPETRARRWAYESASVAYFNPYPHPIRATVSMRLRSLNQREIEVKQNGRMISKVALMANQAAQLKSEFVLEPGPNRFDLCTNQPAIRVGQQRWGLRAFALDAIDWHASPAPAAN